MLFVAVSALLCACALAACAGAGTGATSPPTTAPGSAAPAAKTFSPVFHNAEFSASEAEGDGTNSIDTAHADEGYIGASAVSEARLKLQVALGDMSYNYDLPGDGTPIVVPLNMGNGTYTARIMQNTTADRYIELFSTTFDATMASEFEPYLRPNVFCNYDQSSACVQLASELCADATDESAAFDAVYDYICNNIDYDHDKASQLATVTGYVPNPDETLATGMGICFDYASLVAAMLRSQGIPTKILTGYVSPDNVYHAWDMIYINGAWASLHISARPGQWARADMTFAANGATDVIGDADAYADRYTY